MTAQYIYLYSFSLSFSLFFLRIILTRFQSLRVWNLLPPLILLVTRLTSPRPTTSKEETGPPPSPPIKASPPTPTTLEGVMRTLTQWVAHLTSTRCKLVVLSFPGPHPSLFANERPSLSSYPPLLTFSLHFPLPRTSQGDQGTSHRLT